MGLLSRLFGQCGTIRFEGETFDGRTFSGKTKIELFNVSNEEVEKSLKNKIWVEEGVRVKNLKVVGFCED